MTAQSPDHAAGPLGGLRVIDLAGPAGAFAGRQLGELGADVVRVEPPGGDAVRARPPFLHNEPGVERSLYHLHLNANKRSIAVDLASADGVDRVRALAERADVLVENAAPGEFDALGIGCDELRRLNPGLVYVAVTPFGQRGPMRDYRGNDLTAAAASGLMYLNGFPEDPPNQPGAEQAYHMGSLAAVAGTVMAIAGRERDPQRRGRRVDVSLQEAASMATIQTANANIYGWHGNIPRRTGLSSPGGGRSLFQCRDGRWISFVIPIGAPGLWDGYVQWIADEGLGDLSAPEWTDPTHRFANIPVMMGIISALAEKYDRTDLFHAGQRRRLLVMPVNDASDLIEDEHLAHRGLFTAADHPHLGVALTDVGPPYHFSATPAPPRRPAPVLGEHQDEVLAELAAQPAASGVARAPGPATGLPLGGVRVADFCWMIAGPATTRILADFGATVTKIESEARLDNIRAIGVKPPDLDTVNNNGVFNDTNTNKRSVNINLGTERGIELAKQVIAASDVVTSNFTPDRMTRWGLGYEELAKINPGVIMLSMPVMGSYGPYRGYGSYGNGVIAFGGLNTNMGFPDRAPVGLGPLYSDFSTPYIAVSAVSAALYHRERTGEGQFIDVSQLEATVNLLGTDILEFTANGTVPTPPGNRSLAYVPHGAYPCAGEDRWCAIAVDGDEDWRLLCETIGRPELASDPRLSGAEGRREHEDEIDGAIGAWTGERDAWEVMHTLQAAGLMAAVVEDLEDMMTRDPWLPGNHLVAVGLEGEQYPFTTHAQPIRLNGETPPLRRSPIWGTHNEEVLRGELGLSEDEYLQLVAEQVIF
ncbi:MAG: CoA transferase [Dehalococcoidia bacterium]|jgi:crotonobetainyl-CoA:carnitine CoA-transferase CaiB-like acyl-CoA transferase|nr:CoA transferase [Dehalococcoidia bacterium]